MDITMEILNNIINYGNEERETEMNMNKETEIIEKLEKEAFDLTTEFGHNATSYGIKEAFHTSWINKYRLRQIFRNSPNWNEEAQAIILKGEYNREIDRNIVLGFIDKMRNLLFGNVSEENLSRLWELRYVLTNDMSQFPDNESIDKINRVFPEFNFHYGSKTSRIVDKIFKSDIYKADTYKATELVPVRDSNNHLVIENGDYVLTEREYKPYFREFSKFADAINPIKETRWVVISINFIDFLTMSFFVKGASCHTIDKKNRRNRSEAYHGMYCGGTLSYALDSVSAIVYMLKDDYNPETAEPVYWNGHPYTGFCTQDKLLRQMIHYEGNVMIQGRLYPQENDGGTDLYKTFREIEERVIAECIERPNIWKYTRGTCENRNHCYTADGAHNYEDYFCYDTTGTCIIKSDDGSYKGNEEPMEIGHVGIDINTGEEISGESEYHGVLTETDVCVCCRCGEPLDEDDAIIIDGEYYCRDCVTWCEYHQEYEAFSDTDLTYIDNYGYVCDEGIEEMIQNGDAFRCERCGEVHRWSDDGYFTTNGEWYCCDYCYENDGYVYCSENGELIERSCAVYLNGDWYEEGSQVMCDFCGQLIDVESATVVDGRICCSECLEEELANKQAEM